MNLNHTNRSVAEKEATTFGVLIFRRVETFLHK